MGGATLKPEDCGTTTTPLQIVLYILLSCEELQNVPFLVLGNKIDKGIVSEEQLKNELGITRTTGKGKVPLDGRRPIEVFMCSIIKRSGYGEGFRWVSQYLK